MISLQRHEFNIPDDVHYLNCAYMGPWRKIAGDVIQEQTLRRQRPYTLKANDFFEPVEELKKSFAKLVDCDDHLRIAPLGSVSYGMAQVAKNVKLHRGQKIIMTDGDFPSNVYTLRALAEESGASLIVIERPSDVREWNDAILDAIDDDTGLVLTSYLHWADGFVFDIRAMLEKTHRHGGMMVIDGSQTIGAVPFSIKELPVDALITATYKWLFGPYGFSLGYFGPAFDHGLPIENSWMNRVDSEQFHGLTNYKDTYRPGAWRYSVGEQANLLAINLAKSSIDYILSLGTGNIQDYCKSITSSSLEGLEKARFTAYDTMHTKHHLFGIHCPEGMDQLKLLDRLEKEKVFVSVRGEFVRVSPNVYNSEDEMELLASILVDSI